MPEKATLERARRDKRQGKAASTQAGEFIREELHHIRERKHGARSAKQAVAIGLSKARRAGVDLPAPAKGKTSAGTRRKAAQDERRGRAAPVRSEANVSQRRSAATVKALKRESTKAASHQALSRQARKAAQRRGKAELSRAARKAARTRAEHRASP
jgi:hypothetical protein